MDKALAYGARDCGFKSHCVLLFFFSSILLGGGGMQRIDLVVDSFVDSNHMEQPKVDRNSNLEEGANKKKYAVLFAYCGTNYHGSQACYPYHAAHPIETKTQTPSLMS